MGRVLAPTPDLVVGLLALIGGFLEQSVRVLDGAPHGLVLDAVAFDRLIKLRQGALVGTQTLAERTLFLGRPVALLTHELLNLALTDIERTQVVAERIERSPDLLDQIIRGHDLEYTNARRATPDARVAIDGTQVPADRPQTQLIAGNKAQRCQIQGVLDR